MNKVMLLGNVGDKPEIKTVGSSTNCANFSVATTEKYKKQNGEQVTETQWHKITVFGKVAEIVEKYVNKGDKILIEGKIKYQEYTDKEGNKKHFTNIVATEVKLIGAIKRD